MADEFSSARDSAYNNIGALTDTERKTAAYNALNATYGPAIAYDPTAANNAAVADVTTNTRNDKIDASHRINTADKALVDQYGVQAGDPEAAASDLKTQSDSNEQQRLAQFRALKILQNSVDPATNSVPGDVYDKVIGTYGKVLGMHPDAITQLRDGVTAPGGAQHLDTIGQALIGPTQVAGAGQVVKNADGTNSVVRFDKYGNAISTDLGAKTVAQQRADTGNVNADTGKYRAVTGRLAEQTGQYRAAVTSNNSLFGAPAGAVLPGDNKPSANFNNMNTPLARPSVDLIGAGNPGDKQAAPQVDPKSLFATLPPKGKMAAVAAAGSITQQAAQLANTNTIIDSALKQVSPYTAGTGSTMANLPGTTAADLKANLATLKANGQMAWIASMKNANGSIPGGRLLVSEAKNAEAIFGAMENEQSPKQLSFHLQLFKQAVSNLQAHSRQVFQAQYGVSPEGALGQPEHANTQYTTAQQSLLNRYGVHK
jgi:hypothetical protein